MVEQIRESLRESKAMRWTALMLVAFSMLAGYYVVDMIAPLQELVQTQLHWTPGNYGFFSGSEYWLNMAGFLLISGIILDKLGIRFTGLTAAAVMVLGASVKMYGLSETFNAGGPGHAFFNSFLTSMPASTKLAALGYAIFGIGVEMLGITVSKAIVKWFKGKELALAMGMEMATARLGASIAFFFSAPLAGLKEGVPQGHLMRPVMFGVALLCIGFMTFLSYTFLDKKLDAQEGAGEAGGGEEEAFHFSDLGKILCNKGFWLVSLLCVLFYSGVFPFLKYAVNMMQSKLHISAAAGGMIAGLLPVGTIILTPILGNYLDTKGKGASMMILGAALMTLAHLTFALAPLNVPLAVAAIVVLGVAFSLVPASMWPSIPKIVEERYLGSAYGLVFLIQNWGLGIFPGLVGLVLEKVNPGVTAKIAAGDTTVSYNYTMPMLVFVALGLSAIVLGFLLLKEDKAKGYGLEQPNKH
jgi:MFS family permease